MPVPHDKGPDQGRIVASLAVKCHMPVAEVAVLYEHERAVLAPTARIKQYLHIFVIRKVMDLLHRRRLSRPSGLASQPARGAALAVASPASLMTSAPPRKSSAPPPVLTRRRLVLGTAAGGLLTPSLVACSASRREQDAALRLRQSMSPPTSDRAALTHGGMQDLVRHATLAPSSHNTQCWTFHLQDCAVVIAPDGSRRCPVVDPDDHHLWVSLGCAIENLAQAALAQGLQADARLEPTGAGQVVVTLDATRPCASALFQAIATRQCTRGDYDGQPLSAAELALLARAGNGRGVHLLLLTGRAATERVLDQVLAANTAQMADPAFIRELKTWLRFSSDEALTSGDGLFTGTTGNPVLPRWLGSRVMDAFLTPESENDRYARQIRSSAGIGVFASEANDRAHWLEVGRCYERFALQATALGIRNALINQPVEVGAMRLPFAASLGLGQQRPDLVVRFGRGTAMPLSMRRPVQAVLV